MLMKVKVENGFITQVNGKDITKTSSSLDVHTWNIKIEDNCIRCKTHSKAVSEKKSVTRFPLKNCTVYLINKINDAFCYQREEKVENFLESNSINVVKCMEKENLNISDEQFNQLDESRCVRYDKRIFVSPSKKWVIISEMDGNQFTELWIEKESDFKKFFRDKNFLKEIENEFHMVCWDNWDIPEEYAIKAKPENNGLYVSKISNKFVITFFAGHVGLMPNHFAFALFNGVCDKFYKDALTGVKNIEIEKIQDFYFEPVLGESIQRFYTIDSRYWEPIEL